jgi:hypothetical protein
MEIATVAAGVVDPPVPVSDTVCVELAALSDIVRVPVRVPLAVGVNETLAVQLVPTATLMPQVPMLAEAKSPVKENSLENWRVALPVFVTVTYCTELFEPTLTLPKFKDVEERETVAVVEFLVHVRANALVAPPKSRARADTIAMHERFRICLVKGTPLFVGTE